MIRLIDFIASLFGLIFLLPVFLLIAIWIKLDDSKGPVFFRQKRVGKDGIDFGLYKFRSMYVDSDRHGLITVGGRDPRITRSGFYIRKYKLDELPQLINVLKGDMSMVGPRPEVRKYVDLYTEEQRRVLNVRPGITDYASIEYLDENTLLAQSADPDKTYIEEIMPAKIELNMKFINNPSLSEYLKIIFKTITAIIC
ncbi:MAG: sugar transferase [Prevotella sp.]|nr:sugar transferase [Candidatus Prevotella equi]